ncbi:ATP-binding protein [Flavobacterium sp.]|uniref:ATP-binding protein n=1 Tax=Flavobacterium sp. TaxID=239 RepID=UPI00262CB2AC|nr:ATP-binding protein [Flavobacterium sp.]
MKNQDFNKLEWMEYVIGGSFGNTINKEEIVNKTEVKQLLQFFKITYDELVILALLVDGGIRQEEQGIDSFLEHFGGSIRNLKNINNALQGLISKRYVIAQTKNRLSKTLIKQTFQVDEKVYEALLTNNTTLLCKKPAENFVELLQLIQELIDKRCEGVFDADTLLKLVENELTTAKKCIELDWLNNFNLSIVDKTLFFCTAINYFTNESKADLEYYIKQIEDKFTKQKAIREKIINKTSPLITNELVVKEEDGFAFDEFIELTQKSITALFEKQKKEKKKKSYSTATLLYPDAILDENLFYNPSEWKQINTIEKVLSIEKHKQIIDHLEENGLGKGISILFNGFSGTGKTATAKRLAKLTNRALFCVDVEKIVDKWMGDSEKNVKKIFSEYYEFSKECEHTPILFFNEDSIFSKRVLVNQSTDRSHNSMQNILLEEMENFTGISIVTSNNADKLDPAFERRFLYKVEFEKPNTTTQFQLLQNSFPNMSIDIINQAINNYSFTGGQIYNIRKKYIMQCILEENDLESLFLNLCQEEIKITTSTKIGFGSKL